MGRRARGNAEGVGTGQAGPLSAAPLDRRRRHERRQHAEQAELGQIPAVANPERREACRLDLCRFLRDYFPESTGISPFSDGHHRVIARLQSALLHGGRIMNWVYRGFAKTTITENAAIWASFYGHRKYIAIFGANKAEAQGLIDSISREITTNELLAEDFPEVCMPFLALDGKPQRCGSQTYQGELTGIVQKKDTLVLPTLRLPAGPTAASGAILRARGLLGAARGMKFKRSDGVQQRPDFVLIDDPQDDASARSPQQIAKRLNVIRKGILLSAGHRAPLACAINATCIEAQDLVQQLADRERFPEWEVEKIPMVHSWSSAHETLWQEYAELRRTFAPNVPGARLEAQRSSTEYYRRHQIEMDAGCAVSWESCFDPSTELSAIQHAYNFYFDNGSDVFAAECQGEPISLSPAAVAPLDAPVLTRHVNGFARGEVPESCPHLVGFCDVHDDVLYWMVCAWREDCSGAVVDYGTFPDQNRAYFLKRDAPRTLEHLFGDVGREVKIAQGVDGVVQALAGREWQRTDCTPIHIGKFLIDSGYCADAVEQVCRTSPLAPILQMSRGVGVKASECPISEYRPRTGWQLGEHWYIPKPSKRALRTVRFDSNYWKLWLRARLAIPPPGDGGLSLFGQPGQDHRLLIDHLLSEQPIETAARGRTVIEWRLLAGRDNHWLDCAVGCAVAASLLGCQLHGAVDRGNRTVSRRRRLIEAARRKGL